MQQYGAPRLGGSPYGDPRLGGSQYGDPRLGGSQYADPRLGGSQYADPRLGGSQYVDPRLGGSQYVDPRLGGRGGQLGVDGLGHNAAELGVLKVESKGDGGLTSRGLITFFTCIALFLFKDAIAGCFRLVVGGGKNSKGSELLPTDEDKVEQGQSAQSADKAATPCGVASKGGKKGPGKKKGKSAGKAAAASKGADQIPAVPCRSRGVVEECD